MSIIWLRTAASLYFLGLLYALIYLFRKNTRLFPAAMMAFGAGALFHFVALIELHSEMGHLPFNNFYETSSVCAFLIAVSYLLAYQVYRVGIFGVCLFPVVFFMTLIGATEFPVAAWSSPTVRSAWLLLHITFVLVGYAALILAAVASIYYLVQESRLKSKRTLQGPAGLPPLATLDRIISQSMNIGFAFITAGTVTGLMWAFIENGTHWIMSPEIAFFLFTWLFYFAMIFLRVSAGWRGRRIAWMAVSVLGCSIITWVTHLGIRSIWPQ